MLDLIRPSKGIVLSDGKDVSSGGGWKSYTGSYLNEGFLIDYLTPEEYFEFIGSLNDLPKQEVYSRLESFEELFNGEILGKKKYIRDLSQGNRNKVGISAAMMIRPRVLILDEPFANLDPTTQFRLKKIFKESRSHDVTTLISSHDLDHIIEVCDRIILLEKGIIIKDFKTNEDTLTELEYYFSV